MLKKKQGENLENIFEDPSTLKGTGFVQQTYYDSWGFRTERVGAQCIVALCQFLLGYKQQDSK